MNGMKLESGRSFTHGMHKKSSRLSYLHLKLQIFVARHYERSGVFSVRSAY
jgi:hypothetical protein